MKRVLAAWLCAAALPLAAQASWRDDLTPPRPGNFAPPAELVAKYRFGWGAVTAAEATFDFSRPRKGELQLEMETKTVGAVRSLWRMDASHVARCEAATLRPLRLQQRETYRDESVKTEAEFSAAGVTRRQVRVPADSGPVKTKRFKCPDVFDLHTALLFVRSQRLRAGDVYRFVVYPATSPYLATIRVAGGDEVSTAGRRFRAIRMEVALQRVTKDLKLETHRKFKRATAWLSDDRDRMPLKIRSEVFVGSVWAELVSLQPRGAAVSR